MFSLPRPVPEEDKKDLFAPVADLLVGVVFIFILMVMALSLLLVSDVVPREQHEAQVQALTDERDQAYRVAFSWKAEAERLQAELDAMRKELLVQRERASREAEARQRLAEFVRYVQSVTNPDHDRVDEVRTQRDALLKRIEAALRLKGVRVTANLEQGSLRIPADGMFAPGAADPSPEAKTTLEETAAVLAETLPCQTGTAVVANCGSGPAGVGILSAVYVEGHTDSVPYSGNGGRFRNNWDLSAARAIEAYRIMRDRNPVLAGLTNRDDQALFGVSGYAETRPAESRPARPMLASALTDPRLPEPGRSADRRIEIRFSMVLDGKGPKTLAADFDQRLARALVDARP